MAMAHATGTMPERRAPAKPWYSVLYVQVLIAIVLGALVGWLFPAFATNDWVKAMGDGFIKLIKMVIAPIIFCTVVSGIAHIQDAKQGRPRRHQGADLLRDRVVLRADRWGMIMGNLVPGRRMASATQGRCHQRPAVAGNTSSRLKQQKSVDFVLNIIPDSVVGAFARGDILQVLLFAILFGFALMALGEKRPHLARQLDR